MKVNEFRFIVRDAISWAFLIGTTLGVLLAMINLFIQESELHGTDVFGLYILCMSMHLRSYLRIILAGADFDSKNLMREVRGNARVYLYYTYFLLVFTTTLSATILKLYGSKYALVALVFVGLLLLGLWLLTFQPTFINTNIQLKNNKYFITLAVDIVTFVCAIYIAGAMGGGDEHLDSVVGIMIPGFLLLFVFELTNHGETLSSLFKETKSMLYEAPPHEDC